MKDRVYRSGMVAAGALLMGVAQAPQGWAQEAAAEEEFTLEEVVVTAQKREESLQDVPLSVEAISGDKLVEAGIVRMDDLKAYVPNLQMTETGIANNIYIRGIGSGLNQGFEQSVSLYADGIYRGRGHQARMPFLDLARVEVLRGPQPILFGKNAVAGAVNLVSARPTQEFEGSVRAWYDMDLKETVGDLVLSGPVNENFGARLAVRSRNSDGYVDNLTLGRGEPSREELGGRLTLTWNPSETFDATLRLEGGSFDNTGRHLEIFGEAPTTNPAFGGQTYSQIVAGGPLPLLAYPTGLPQGTNATSSNNGIDYLRSSSGDLSELRTRELALTLNWELGNGATITSLTGYSAYDLDELCDCDFVGSTVFNAGVTEEFKQMSQELRITSAPGTPFTWIGGLFYQDYELDESDYLYVPPTSLVVPVLARNPAVGAASALLANAANPRVFAQDSKQFSVFAQGTFNVSDRFRVTAGGRWSKEDKDGSRVTSLNFGVGGPPLASAVNPALVPFIGPVFANVLGIVPHSVSGSRSESTFSPLVNLQYDFGADSMAYLSWARGSKAGGFDARSNRAPAAGGTFEFEDEQATTYELGVKSRIADTAEVNAALFFTDYKDLQTSAFDGAIGFNVGNGTAEVKGVEVEGRWQATSRYRLSGSLAWLDFEWKNYAGQCYFNAPLSIRVGGVATSPNCNYAGFSNQLAPKLTGVLSNEYAWSVGSALELRGTLDVVYSDDYLLSLTLDPAAVQKSYAKVNARLSLGPPEGRWQLALIGRNLTDETTLSYAGDTPLAQRLFGARSYYGFVDPPRSVALEAAFRF